MARNTQTVIQQFHKVTSEEVAPSQNLNSFLKELNQSQAAAGHEIPLQEIVNNDKQSNFTIDDKAAVFSDEEEEVKKGENEKDLENVDIVILEEKTEADLKLIPEEPKKKVKVE